MTHPLPITVIMLACARVLLILYRTVVPGAGGVTYIYTSSNSIAALLYILSGAHYHWTHIACGGWGGGSRPCEFTSDAFPSPK